MDIRDIAKRAGVSTATVSRTINRVPTVSPKLAKKVWSAIEELGYYPNTHARSLVSGRTRTFGLIVSEITNPFFPRIVQVFEDLGLQHGYEVLVSSTVHDAERMKLAVRRMIERRVDGVAILTFGMEESLLEDLKVRKVPLAFVDVGPARTGFINIGIEYEPGLRQAVEHLATLGHERIAYISGPANVKSAVKRREVFLQAAAAIALEVSPELVVQGDHTAHGGRVAAQSLLAMRNGPSAIICSNDLTALGAMRSAYDAGIRIPGDLSLVGFDDIWLSEYLSPPLTTVQMSQAELARLAFHALLKEAQRDEHPPSGSQYILPTRLVVRGSTGRASHARDRRDRLYASERSTK